MQLVDQALAGNRRALARLISQVENDGALAAQTLAVIYPRTGRAHVVGITGSPGTGKSTLVSELAKVYRRAGQTVGIVAVDPNVIPLRSRIYVFGYGVGDAGDTGSAIKGRRIDLGYDDDDPKVWTWYRWTDVYLLTPVPADVNYVIADWPPEP